MLHYSVASHSKNKFDFQFKWLLIHNQNFKQTFPVIIQNNGEKMLLMLQQNSLPLHMIIVKQEYQSLIEMFVQSWWSLKRFVFSFANYFYMWLKLVLFLYFYNFFGVIFKEKSTFELERRNYNLNFWILILNFVWKLFLSVFLKIDFSFFILFFCFWCQFPIWLLQLLFSIFKFWCSKYIHFFCKNFFLLFGFFFFFSLSLFFLFLQQQNLKNQPNSSNQNAITNFKKKHNHTGLHSRGSKGKLCTRNGNAME